MECPTQKDYSDGYEEAKKLAANGCALPKDRVLGAIKTNMENGRLFTAMFFTGYLEAVIEDSYVFKE